MDKKFSPEGEQVKMESYLNDALRNIKALSRTAQGTISTESSAKKGDSLVKIDADKISQTAISNFTNTLVTLFNKRNIRIESPDDIKSLLLEAATSINQGIVTEGRLFREFDSEKYPYSHANQLEERLNVFAATLLEKIQNEEDPKEIAAWVEYVIDLTDHYFSDGCGKTAKAMSSWVLMRADVPLPDYSQGAKIPNEEIRKTYYAHAPKTRPGSDAEQETREFNKWLKYYKNLWQE